MIGSQVVTDLSPACRSTAQRLAQSRSYHIDGCSKDNNSSGESVGPLISHGRNSVTAWSVVSVLKVTIAPVPRYRHITLPTIPSSQAIRGDRNGGYATLFRQRITIDLIVSKAVHSTGPHRSGQLRIIITAACSRFNK